MNDIWVLREADFHEFPPSKLTSTSTDVPTGSYVINPLSVTVEIEDPRFDVDPIAILLDCVEERCSNVAPIPEESTVLDVEAVS